MPRKLVYSRWLWQLTKPGMSDGLAEVDERGAGAGGAHVVGRAHGDDALAGDGDRAVPDGRGGDGEQPVGAIDGGHVAPSEEAV